MSEQEQFENFDRFMSHRKWKKRDTLEVKAEYLVNQATRGLAFMTTSERYREIRQETKELALKYLAEIS